MNKAKRVLTAVLAGALLMTTISGCTDKSGEESVSEAAVDQSSAGSSVESITDSSAESSVASDDSSVDEAAETVSPVSTFDFSEGIDENGYWSNVTAADNVELVDYKNISVPADVHTVSDETIDTEANNVLKQVEIPNTERAVADGDKVNMDYVGSIDGVEFEGGNTGGMGTEVTIGVDSYIDDFLEQLIGHTPGETFDVEVTFPDEYPMDETLEGKDAVFVTTINFIADTKDIEEIDDAFVAENMAENYGWNTVEEMRTEIHDTIRKNNIRKFLEDYLKTESEVKSLPDSMRDYQNDYMVFSIEQNAMSNQMTLEEFLPLATGVSTIDELIEAESEGNKGRAEFFLILQAIAEKEGIEPTEADAKEVFDVQYENVLETYGKNFMNQNVICEIVLKQIEDNLNFEK